MTVKFSKEEAFRAVRAFEELKGQLQVFARHMTGNPKLEIITSATMTATNGHLISVRPPLGLGVDRVHDRAECGKRDEEYRMLCDACDSIEIIYFQLFHEVAHIIFGSRNAHGNLGRSIFENYLRKWHPVEECNHSQFLSFQRRYNDSALDLAHLCNPYLGTMVNALDDVRVNEGTFSERHGLRDVFASAMNRLVNGSDTDLEGNTFKLSEDSPESQFIIGCMLQAGGFLRKEHISPEVMKDVREERIRALCSASAKAETQDESFQIAVMWFEIGHELGYFQDVQACEKPEPEPEPEPTPETNEDEEPGDAEDTTGDDSSDAPEGKEDDRPEEDDDPGDDSATGSDEACDENGDDDQPDAGPDDEPSDEGDRGDDGSPDDPGSGAGPGETDEAFPDSDEEGNAGPSDVGNDDDVSDESHGDDNGESGDGRPDAEDGDPFEGSDSEDDHGMPGTGNTASGGNSQGEYGPGGTVDSTDSVQGGSERDLQDVAQREDSEPATLDADGGDPTDTVHSESGLDEIPDAEGDRSREGEGEAGSDAPPVAENPWDIEAPEIPSEEVRRGQSLDGPSGPASGITEPSPRSSDPTDVAATVQRYLGHAAIDEIAGGDIADIVGADEDKELSPEDMELLETAIRQALHFDDASYAIKGVEIIPWPTSRDRHKWLRGSRFDVEALYPDPSIMSRPLLVLREMFADNRKAKLSRNEKSGHINSRVLGSRAPTGDPRLFGHRTKPGRQSYEVCLMVDCSSSNNNYGRMDKIKRMVFMQAEMLSTLGIKFSIIAHTSGQEFNFRPRHRDSSGQAFLYIQEIKLTHERWGAEQKSKLAGLCGSLANLDGHAMEYARKVMVVSRATDRIVIYYTDGNMPQANFAEEKEILVRELDLMSRMGIEVLGVGVNTDSPRQYGLNTVRVECDDDILKVQAQLVEALTTRKKRR